MEVIFTTITRISRSKAARSMMIGMFGVYIINVIDGLEIANDIQGMRVGDVELKNRNLMVENQNIDSTPVNWLG